MCEGQKGNVYCDGQLQQEYHLLECQYVLVDVETRENGQGHQQWIPNLLR